MITTIILDFITAHMGTLLGLLAAGLGCVFGAVRHQQAKAATAQASAVIAQAKEAQAQAQAAASSRQAEVASNALAALKCLMLSLMKL